MIELRFDVEKSLESKLRSFLDTLKVEQYVLSYETSDIKRKAHWQGFCEFSDSSEKINTIQKKCREFSVEKLKLSKGHYCFAKVKKPDIWRSYILKNTNKVLSIVLSKNAIDYDSIETFNEERDCKVPKDTWNERCYRKLVEEVIEDGCYINYNKIEDVVYSMKPVKISAKIIEELLLGLTSRLEEEYPDGYNTRVHRLNKERTKSNKELDNIFNRKVLYKI